MHLIGCVTARPATVRGKQGTAMYGDTAHIGLFEARRFAGVSARPMVKGRSGIRRGAAAVEMAVLLPLFIVLLFGLWEASRLVHVQQIVSNAAREGARQAATAAKTTDQVIEAVNNYLLRAGIPTSGVAVTIENLTDPARSNPIDARQMDHLRVTVQVDPETIAWILPYRIVSHPNLRARADWFAMADIPLEINPDLPLE